MPHAARILCHLLLASTLSAAAPEGVRYLEPAMATVAEHPDHGRYFVFFCGHCPKARQFMAEKVKALQDAVIANQAPVEIVCLTPELADQDLRAYADALGLDGVALGHDALNPRKISLQNILQVRFEPGTGGTAQRLSIGEVTERAKDPARHAELGSYTFDPAGIDDPEVRRLWWAIESRRPGAVAYLAKAHRRARPDDPVGSQVIALYDAVSEKLLGEIERLIAAGDDFATYEQLERAIQAAEGLETRDGERRLAELARDDQIQRELKARTGWRRCQELLASPKPKEQEMGRAGLAQVAELLPDTVYGRKAAATR